MTQAPFLSWTGILRLACVQTALGAIVVLTTSTLNRVMVVELALPAMLPGALVALHYGLQMVRPRFGHGSDLGGRRTPWIMGGMAALALGGILAAIATALMTTSLPAGIGLAVLAFALIGLGVGAAGTNLLVLLAKRVEPRRRPAAATIVWVMMIAGFVVTAGLAGRFLDPFSPERLVAVSTAVSVCALLVALLAVRGMESDVASPGPEPRESPVPFKVALAQVWGESRARHFTIFIFVSMLAYSGQDLILEPFAGTVFGYAPGQSTSLAGVQNGGVLVGMIAVALLGTGLGGRRFGSLRLWTVGGCLASALALAALSLAGSYGPAWPLRTSVFGLGLANGAFAVAAIGSMMELAGCGGREGVRMGLWGAAQAVAFGLGGFLAAAAVDLVRWSLGSPVAAYTIVFCGEAALFLVAAVLASRIGRPAPERRAAEMTLAWRGSAGG
ncbi:MAG TPA: BCD family MFS transporter [Beijerinckiaceae bacterium]|jgi:BCD family chlorophyll transporter-like MFS transporter